MSETPITHFGWKQSTLDVAGCGGGNWGREGRAKCATKSIISELSFNIFMVTDLVVCHGQGVGLLVKPQSHMVAKQQ